jgi:hypothetical protein
MIPWSEPISRIALVPTFVDEHMVVAVMFFYAAHRVLFMINGSMLMANGLSDRKKLGQVRWFQIF